MKNPAHLLRKLSLSALSLLTTLTVLLLLFIAGSLTSNVYAVSSTYLEYGGTHSYGPNTCINATYTQTSTYFSANFPPATKKIIGILSNNSLGNGSGAGHIRTLNALGNSLNNFGYSQINDTYDTGPFLDKKYCHIDTGLNAADYGFSSFTELCDYYEFPSTPYISNLRDYWTQNEFTITSDARGMYCNYPNMKDKGQWTGSFTYYFLIEGEPPTSGELWTLNGINIYNNNTGNVGIGTGSPLTKFHFVADTADQTFTTAPRIQARGVAGGNSNMVNLNLFTSSAVPNTSSGLAFSMLNMGPSPVEYARIRSVVVDGTRVSEDGALDLMTKQNGTLTSSVRITNEGRVGIGTTSPTEKLTVAGNIKTTSSAGKHYTGTISSTGWYTELIDFPVYFNSIPIAMITHDNTGTGDVVIDAYYVFGTMSTGTLLQYHVSSVAFAGNTIFYWFAIAKWI